MIIGASSFAGSFPELKQEVDSVELYIPKLGVYKGNELLKSRIERIKDELSVYDISTSIHAPYFSEAPNYPRELRVDTAKLSNYRLLTESIEIAEILESSVVVVHPGRINSNRKASFENMVVGLSELAKFAEERNVIIGLENKEATDTQNLCCFAFELIEAVERINSDNVGVTLDIGHANLTCKGNQSKLREFVREVKDYVVHVHIHDNNGVSTQKYWGDSHSAPGKGVVDFNILKELDFQGVYNLEVFSIEDVKEGKKMLMMIGIDSKK